MKTKRMQKLLSLLLALAMVISLVPVSVFADDEPVEEEKTETVEQKTVTENKEDTGKELPDEENKQEAMIDEGEENAEFEKKSAVFFSMQTLAETEDPYELVLTDTKYIKNDVFTSKILEGCFGGEGDTISFASVSDGKIKNVSLRKSLLGYSSTELEAKEYIAYKNGNTEEAAHFRVTIKYTITFEINYTNNAVPEGEPCKLLVDGNAVASGSSAAYPAGTVLTIATEASEGYMCVASPDSPYTVSAAKKLTAEFRPADYAQVEARLDPAEGGSASVMVGGKTLADGRVDAGAEFTVAIKPDKNNGYYLAEASYSLNEGGEETISGESVTLTAEAYGKYVVLASFGKLTITMPETVDVSLLDIQKGNWDAVKQAISDAADLSALPEGFAYDVEVAYQNGSSWTTNFATKDGGLLSNVHAFGKATKGGVIDVGNQESVRVTFTGKDAFSGVKVIAESKAVIIDDRAPVTISGQQVSMSVIDSKEEDKLLEAIAANLSIKNEENQEIDWTKDDISLEPKTLGGSMLPQQVTVTFGGNDTYAKTRGTVSVKVAQLKATIDVKSEKLGYGETPKLEVRTEPANLDYIRVVGGIDGDACGYVSIDIPQSLKSKMRFDVPLLGTIDIYEMIAGVVNAAPTLKDTIDGLNNLFNGPILNNDLVKGILNTIGIDPDGLLEMVNMLTDIMDMVPGLDVQVRLNGTPMNRGVYLVGAVSMDSDYTMAMDVAYLTIAPEYTHGEDEVKLVFKNPIEGGKLSYSQAKSFDFGAVIQQNGENISDEAQTAMDKHIAATFVRVKGLLNVDIGKEFAAVPGMYTQTTLTTGGNYVAMPIHRSFTVNRQTVAITPSVTTLEVTYGDDFQVKLADAVVAGDESEPVEGALVFNTTVEHEDGLENVRPTVRYVGVTRAYNSTTIPAVPGTYKVVASYNGDSLHSAASAQATLVIKPRDVVITVDSQEVVYGEDVKLSYTSSNPDEDVDVTLWVNAKSYSNVGTYQIKATAKAAANVKVTVIPGTLVVKPRPVMVTLNSAVKTYGNADPAFTYSSIESFNQELGRGLKPGDKLPITIVRESGKNVGVYKLSVKTSKVSTNYVVETNEAALTIRPKNVKVMVGNLTKKAGAADPAFKFSLGEVKVFGRVVYSPILSGDSLNLVLTRAEGEEIGSYKITAKSWNPNYNPILSNASLTIRKK